jgi:predicted nucleic acid-binding protein
MHKNIFVDLNIVVDILLERRGFEASRDVIRLGANGCVLHMSGHTVTTLAYLLERASLSRPQIHQCLIWTLRTFRITPTTHELLAQALVSPIQDYEDAVVEAAAIDCRAAAIISRNIKDFTASSVPAYTP